MNKDEIHKSNLIKISIQRDWIIKRLEEMKSAEKFGDTGFHKGYNRAVERYNKRIDNLIDELFS